MPRNPPAPEGLRAAWGHLRGWGSSTICTTSPASPRLASAPTVPVTAPRPLLGQTPKVDVRVFLLMAQGAASSPWASLVPLVIMLGIFYFLLIAPMRKRQKQQEQMIADLKTGDHVVTAGGIYGTIVGIKEDRLTLRIADQVKVEVTKSSISGLDDAAAS